MNLIIAGTRTFNNFTLLEKEVHSFIHRHQEQEYEKITVICGMARGADLLGRRLAIENNWEVVEMAADWNRFGKAAGYKRNTEMAKVANACIVFWDGKSKGTGHMINLAKEYKLILRVIQYE